MSPIYVYTYSVHHGGLAALCADCVLLLHVPSSYICIYSPLAAYVQLLYMYIQCTTEVLLYCVLPPLMSQLLYMYIQCTTEVLLYCVLMSQLLYMYIQCATEVLLYCVLPALYVKALYTVCHGGLAALSADVKAPTYRVPRRSCCTVCCWFCLQHPLRLLSDGVHQSPRFARRDGGRRAALLSHCKQVKLLIRTSWVCAFSGYLAGDTSIRLTPRVFLRHLGSNVPCIFYVQAPEQSAMERIGPRVNRGQQEELGRKSSSRRSNRERKRIQRRRRRSNRWRGMEGGEGEEEEEKDEGKEEKIRGS